MHEVKVTNMTSLFSKEMLIYSFFDVRLKSPLRVTQMLYFIILFVLIGLPVFSLAWPPNVYSTFVALGVPLGGSYFMSKPIWNGKSFMSFARTQLRYLFRPKVYYDWQSREKTTEYTLDNSIQVSRHADYRVLYKIIREEEFRRHG